MWKFSSSGIRDVIRQEERAMQLPLIQAGRAYRRNVENIH
jgi:hypothetical protein